MLRIAEVYVRDNIHYASVCLLGEALVLAAVAGFHVEDGNVQTFCRNRRQAGVCVAKNQQGVGVDGRHKLVGGVYDIADSSAQIVAHGIHINFGVGKLEILEEYAVKIIVVILSGVGQNHVEVFTTFVNGCRQAYNLGAGTNDNQ